MLSYTFFIVLTTCIFSWGVHSLFFQRSCQYVFIVNPCRNSVALDTVFCCDILIWHPIFLIFQSLALFSQRLICQFSLNRHHPSLESIWWVLLDIILLPINWIKRSNFQTFKLWPKCYDKSLRQREEIIQMSNNFVQSTVISRFELPRVFSPKIVRNDQGTEEFIGAIEKFEKSSIRVFRSLT